VLLLVVIVGFAPTFYLREAFAAPEWSYLRGPFAAPELSWRVFIHGLILTHCGVYRDLS
jgi:hypothetical protein